MDVSGAQLFQGVFLRWLDIVGVVLFVGLAAFRQLTFIPTIQTLQNRETRSGMLAEEDAHLSPLFRFLLSYLIVLHLLTLVYQAGMMSGWNLSELALNIPVVLTKPHFGLVWVVKAVLLSVLLILLRFRRKGPLLLIMSCLLCLLGSLGGHAIAREAHYIVLTDWLHYTAVSVWAGGLLPLRGIARRTQGWIEPSDLSAFLSRIVEVFSAWAILCVITIIMTGSFNAMVYLGPRGIVIEPPYGKILLLKLCFVLAAFGLGGFSRFYLLPRLQKCEKDASADVALLERLFYRAITIELGVVMTVLVFAALLTQTPPPHLKP